MKKFLPEERQGILLPHHPTLSTAAQLWDKEGMQAAHTICKALWAAMETDCASALQCSTLLLARLWAEPLGIQDHTAD